LSKKAMAEEVCGAESGAAPHAADLRKRFAALRIPVLGSIDLTARCNLNCLHCYQGGSGRLESELSTEEWLSILERVAAAGCLELLVTGGEPLLRGDFEVIYEKAKRLGMLVTVFTNGTLVSPSVLGLFEEFPPLIVEISLYGASDRVYERISGVRGSFRRCLEGIDSLMERGVDVGLKTVLLTKNVRELEEMRGLARDRGLPFRIDAAVFPRLNGDRSPLDYRITAEEAVRSEMRINRERRTGRSPQLRWVEYSPIRTI
jgi:MoaA/NifB/PqqE/SkfB family radical SAM enzyme